MKEEWYFHTGQHDEAIALVERFHYSGKMPPSLVLVGTAHECGGLFGDFGTAVAACVFGYPAARWREEVVELHRLVRRDDTEIPLTWLISRTCKAIRRFKTDVDLLVSYADQTQTHHGGIYQAASWNYNGRRDRARDGLIINGTYLACRTCNHRYGTSSVLKLETKYPAWNIEPHYDEGKHLYWRAIRKSGKHKAKRLGLEHNPYPRPEEK